TDGDVISTKHLPDHCVTAQFNEKARFSLRGELKTLADIEKEYLKWAVTHFQGDKKQLAEKLGLGERTLYRKLKTL
ncbi:MAG TPA: AAA family ATPase, partial [Gammaproteobacteria bacterium]|nr:AAA family ATPase [Gammaproteobacteria bacterium]